MKVRNAQSAPEEQCQLTHTLFVSLGFVLLGPDGAAVFRGLLGGPGGQGHLEEQVSAPGADLGSEPASCCSRHLDFVNTRHLVQNKSAF